MRGYPPLEGDAGNNNRYPTRRVTCRICRYSNNSLPMCLIEASPAVTILAQASVCSRI